MTERTKLLTSENFIRCMALMELERKRPCGVSEIVLFWATETCAIGDQINYILDLLGRNWEIQNHDALKPGEKNND
jgi:hypothetical protein